MFKNHALLNVELHEAVRTGDAGRVIELINQGADVNTRDENGKTPLHSAAENGYTALVVLLLKRGADIDARSEGGVTPLYIAAYHGHEKIVGFLLKRGANIVVNNYGGTPLQEAALRGYTGVVLQLLENGSDVESVDKDLESPLVMAARKGYTEVVEILLDNGADINTFRDYDGTALYCAASNGHTETVKLLLARGADVNLPNKLLETPLFMAAGGVKNNTEVVALLLDNGANVNGASIISGDTPLHLAVKGNKAEIVALLATKGADVNFIDKRGKTPLHYAMVGNGDKAELIETLLIHGADINIPYKDGITALDHFVNCILNPNREANTSSIEAWILRSPQCITATIVANNDNPETQKEILTCVIKQYAILLQSTQIETEQGQKLEEGYRAIITSAVRANPNLYDVANSFCNMVSDLCENIPGNVVGLVGSYLTISPYTLHNGIPTILECIREAVPQQEQTREGSRGWAASISSHGKEARPSR